MAHVLHARKRHPFLSLCLTVTWISIAAEMLHFTDGRPGQAGSLALQCIVAGLIVWGILDLWRPAFCARRGKFLLLLCGLLALALIPRYEGAPYTAVVVAYGVCSGMCLSFLLTDYLRREASPRRLIWIGLAGGIYATAVFPFGLLFIVLQSLILPEVLRAAGFLLIALLLAAIFFARGPEDAVRQDRDAGPLPLRSSLAKAGPAAVAQTVVMIVSVVALTFLHQLLKSGILELYGGTVNAPAAYIVDLASRIPLGLLVGWLATRQKWYYAVGFPLALMVTGAVLCLFAEGGPVRDWAVLGLLDLGGNGFLLLVFTLAMQTAIWNGNRAIIASFGALLPLTLVAFFNINALGITPEHFDTVLRDPLALATAPLAVIIFLLIIAFLANSRVPGTVLKASAMETNLDAGTDNSSEATGTGPVSIDTMLPLERAIANLLMEGYAKGEIARKLHLSATEVNESVRVIRRRLAQTQEALPEERFERIAETYGLTKREMQVLRCVVEGKSNGEIAAELFIVEETVKFHMKNLTRKLPVNGRRHMRDWLMSK